MKDVSSGFLRPTTTPTPDEPFDVWLLKLSGSELKVLLYIVRRTFGFQKEADAISLTQICEGITTRDGRVLDHGTGLARSTAAAAVRQLEEHGLIAVERVRDEERGFISNFYRLRFHDDDTDSAPHDDDDSGPADDSHPDDAGGGSDSPAEIGGDQADKNSVGPGSEIGPGVVRKSNQASSKIQPALVRKSNPQQTALQETAAQQTEGQETEGQPPPPPPPPEQGVSEHGAPAREAAAQAGGDAEADSEAGSDRPATQFSLIHPSPTTHPNQHLPVTEEQQRVVDALVAFGVWRAKAEQLVDKLGLSEAVVERACAALGEEQKRGTSLTNPGAVLVARLESGWEPPPRLLNPFARWGVNADDEEARAVPALPVDTRPPLPPVVTASGTEHNAYAWFAALKSDLQLQMVQETYDTWLHPAELVDHVPASGETQTTLNIRLHNLYAKAWIEHRLDKVIRRQAVRMLGKAVRLVYVGPEEAEQQPDDPPWWERFRTDTAAAETERSAS